LFLVFNALSYKFDDFSNTCVTRVVWSNFTGFRALIVSVVGRVNSVLS
jgi:hypothetical protein